MTTTDAIRPLIGSQVADVLIGGVSSEIISGRGGNDTLLANSGYDNVYGGSGDDLINGGAGDDTLYGGGGPSWADMNRLSIAEDYTGQVTFLGETAGFRNALGMYKVAEDGTITDVQIVFANASAQGSGGSLVPGESTAEVILNAGDQIGFFVISDAVSRNSLETLTTGSYAFVDAQGNPATLNSSGSLTLVRTAPDGSQSVVQSRYTTTMFHSAATPEDGYGLNDDNYAHTVGHVNAQDGTITLGFEDLWGGGDNDYDDVVFLLDIGQSNARVLDPNIAQANSGDDQDWVYGADGNRYDLQGTLIASENDTIHGGTGSDNIYGMAGNDILFGDDGHDVIYGNSGADIVEGGSGDDQLRGGKGNDTLRGDNGNDTLTGNSGDDILEGDGGDDLLDGSDGDDLLIGGDNDDTLKGGTGNDTLHGESGTDSLSGGKGDDLLYGGSGDDQLDGDTGNDVIFGGSGDDTINGGSHDDVIDGEDGADRIDGGSGDDRIDGGVGNDHILSGSGNDIVDGGDGDDYISAHTGDDVLSGGAGNDKIAMGKGNDVITGGAGSDRFVFRAGDLDGSTDRITDFRHDGAEADWLDLCGLNLTFGDIDIRYENAGATLTMGATILRIEDAYGLGAETLMAQISDGLILA